MRASYVNLRSFMKYAKDKRKSIRFGYVIPKLNRGNEDLSTKSFGESLHVSGNTGQLITTKQDNGFPHK
uniref:Uncharacterized protein n=1 Tax=Tanacetum cinerariifolium TaxID=118510 RepID=A0A699SBY9_TANCI|nr:hypothetical protein [Tanacetum cinerariifolium]